MQLICLWKEGWSTRGGSLLFYKWLWSSVGFWIRWPPVKIFFVAALDILIWYHLFLQEIPMNFVDPKEIDIPRHGTKNRYKTILPSKFLEWNSSHYKAKAFPSHPYLITSHPHNFSIHTKFGVNKCTLRLLTMKVAWGSLLYPVLLFLKWSAHNSSKHMVLKLYCATHYGQLISSNISMRKG